MATHTTGTREEWLTARLEAARGREGISRDAATSWRGGGRSCRGCAIDKDYRFDTDEGSASLQTCFDGRSQLLVYHFMFGPDYTAGCPSCSAIADGFNGSRRSSGEPRCDADGGVAGAAREAAGVQAADGVDVSMGVLVRRRFQSATSMSGSPSSSSATGIEYNYRARATGPCARWPAKSTRGTSRAIWRP